MNLFKFGCLQSCGSVLEFCSRWKCSRGFVALTGIHHDYGGKIIAPANRTQLQCLVEKPGLPLNIMRMRSVLRFSRDNPRKIAFFRKGDSLEEVACFEERLFVQGETCYSAFSLSSNCSSGVGNRREEETAGSVQTMEKAEGKRVDNAQDLLKEVEQALGSPLGTQPQAPSRKPLVIVISGPSGVGKDAVINRLQEVRQEIHFVVTATTRAKRPGEVHGKDYFFLSKEQFESMIQNNELLEYAIVYGDYKGIPKGQVRECLAKGFDVVLRVDVQGAATVRSILGSNAVFIFLVAESEAALVRRLIERKTETNDKLLLRIATAREEVQRMDEFDYVVVNADRQIEKSVSLICCIIDSEKARVHQREAHL